MTDSRRPLVFVLAAIALQVALSWLWHNVNPGTLSPWENQLRVLLRPIIQLAPAFVLGFVLPKRPFLLGALVGIASGAIDIGFASPVVNRIWQQPGFYVLILSISLQQGLYSSVSAGAGAHLATRREP